MEKKISKINNFLKIGTLLSIMTILISCNNKLYEERIAITKDTIMNNESFIKEHINIQDKASIFEIVNYFSVNYPYSIAQVKNYFDTDFIVENQEDITFERMILSPSNNTSNIEELEIRTRIIDHSKQTLIIKFSNSICFASDYLAEKMASKDYTLVLSFREFYFSKIMDEDKKLGTKELFFDFKDSNKDKKICIKALTFSTFTTFDKSQYE